jgi:Skp family chaperone for outer membrane proteins
MSLKTGLAVFALISGLLAADSARAQEVKKERPTDRPPRIGVVDLARALRDAPAIRAIEEQMAKDHAEFLAKRDEMMRQVTRKREEMELGSDEDVARLEKEIEKILWDLKTDEAFLQNRRGKLLFEAYKKLYPQIDAAAKRVAEALELDLVLIDSPVGAEQVDQAKNPEQLQALLTSRQILYVNSRLDITDEVLKALPK